MNIGPYSLPSQVLLAPMAGTSDKPFRMICRAQGAGLTTSEMVVMQNHLLNSNKSKHRLDFTSEQSPISIQIAGSEAEELAESARKAVDFGADIIDINMGCPAKKVCNKAAGSALMQNEKLVEDIIKSVVNAVDIPVTLKMRTGWNEENKNAPIIAKIAEEFGIQMLAIHGRTRSQKYNGEAEFNTVKKITKMVSIPVVANGDITSPEKAKDVLDFTGADAIMLGRATQGNPWLVGQVNHFLKTGNKAEETSLDKKIPLILSHILQIHDFYGHKMGTQLSRKHIFWYSMHLDQEKGTAFWPNINRVSDHSEQYSIFHDFLYSI
ncbi:tRNA dihydrouridine synthase DusB [Candidatus Thioglobus sp.]|jgi:tRNA-dihydrouridine synthase B|uniref:tRNA dihydrouridine synthase DusB n=1 Tax=Candidatus Pseudothioglobus sp. Uisw_041 TaxID=3230996 RepID=UPI002303C9C5|nr:tRNA dihydrouridine synthase DusB [Candidatus Thioglobus sp.]MDA8981248.1 tRNA dihydrouridine synthase DusB [Candidatus Thioglobus sp.]MDA9057780.1 tRNA dihydrouridine synthase DusB [Candidatus Thioglobus sp.]MDB4027166.1 tRNA dihydrouridine synthase DusB [Candidatus Thioglobus sp.]MDB4056738.1 tRNA dihydrouridine synthase DusB [Candidatus Thioglobus sp.]MDB9864293.1 tRNA dihydrouridine synthase DusB [Candidatus Thioglobus sp.]